MTISIPRLENTSKIWIRSSMLAELSKQDALTASLYFVTLENASATKNYRTKAQISRLDKKSELALCPNTEFHMPA